MLLCQFGKLFLYTGECFRQARQPVTLELTADSESPAYRISKAALNMLTVVLAAELREAGILVNAASPGYTRTRMSPNATRTVESGADTPVWLATLPADGPSGGYFYDRSPLPW